MGTKVELTLEQAKDWFGDQWESVSGAVEKFYADNKHLVVKDDKLDLTDFCNWAAKQGESIRTSVVETAEHLKDEGIAIYREVAPQVEGFMARAGDFASDNKVGLGALLLGGVVLTSILGPITGIIATVALAALGNLMDEGGLVNKLINRSPVTRTTTPESNEHSQGTGLGDPAIAPSTEVQVLNEQGTPLHMGENGAAASHTYKGNVVLVDPSDGQEKTFTNAVTGTVSADNTSLDVTEVSAYYPSGAVANNLRFSDDKSTLVYTQYNEAGEKTLTQSFAAQGHLQLPIENGKINISQDAVFTQLYQVAVPLDAPGASVENIAHRSPQEHAPSGYKTWQMTQGEAIMYLNHDGDFVPLDQARYKVSVREEADGVMRITGFAAANDRGEFPDKMTPTLRNNNNETLTFHTADRRIDLNDQETHAAFDGVINTARSTRSAALSLAPEMHLLSRHEGEALQKGETITFRINDGKNPIEATAVVVNAAVFYPGSLAAPPQYDNSADLQITSITPLDNNGNPLRAEALDVTGHNIVIENVGSNLKNGNANSRVMQAIAASADLRHAALIAHDPHLRAPDSTEVTDATPRHGIENLHKTPSPNQGPVVS